MLRAQVLATALNVCFNDLDGNKIGTYSGNGSARQPIGAMKMDLSTVCKVLDGSDGTGTCIGGHSLSQVLSVLRSGASSPMTVLRTPVAGCPIRRLRRFCVVRPRQTEASHRGGHLRRDQEPRRYDRFVADADSHTLLKALMIAPGRSGLDMSSCETFRQSVRRIDIPLSHRA
jgi:hypothetical protein